MADWPELFDRSGRRREFPERGRVHYGRWESVVRSLAPYGGAEEAELVRLPLRDLLGRYWQHLRATELERYRVELQMWNHRACLVSKPGAPPDPPRFLDP